MIDRKRRIRIAAILLALLACYSAASQAASILGDWKLVEQTYGDGAANLIDPESAALRMTFVRSGANLQGMLYIDNQRDSARSWPRLDVDESRAVHVLEKRLSDDDSEIVTRYRVDPTPGDDLVLEVTESYRLHADGTSLQGLVVIRFERDGEARGSYTLHRRFERQSQ